MKIVRNKDENTVLFGTLPVGSVIESNGEIFLVIPTVWDNNDGEDEERNAFNVSYNHLDYFHSQAKVHSVEAELRILT